MGKNRLIINESEKIQIKSLYNINEQQSNNGVMGIPGTGKGSTPTNRPGINKTDFVNATKPQKLRGGLFVIGSDKIDTSSDVFITAVNKIKVVLNGIPGQVPITITGGASKVGSASFGMEKNVQLANRRRDNFILALTNALGGLFSRLIITKGDGVVGTSTEKNSTQANQEQFVQITYPEQTTMIKLIQTTAVDNTSVAVRPDVKGYPQGGNSTKLGNPFMIVKMWYKGDKIEFKRKILNSTGSPAHELVNYDDAKGLKFE